MNERLQSGTTTQNGAQTTPKQGGGWMGALTGGLGGAAQGALAGAQIYGLANMGSGNSFSGGYGVNPGSNAGVNDFFANNQLQRPGLIGG